MTPPGAPPLVLRRADAWKVAIVATLAMSVSYIDRQTLAAIAPTVRKALLIDAEQYGWLTGAFSMAYLVGAPVSGAMIDKVGARRGLTAAVLVWSLVSGLHALTSSFVMLFALRIALGTAEAPSFPGAAQTVRRILPRGDRSSGFGLLFTGSSIGSMIAAPLAIKLNAAWGWRGAFIGTALAGLAWIPLWLRTTRRPALRDILGPALAGLAWIPLWLRTTRRPALRDILGPAPATLGTLDVPAGSIASAPSRFTLLASAPVLRAVVLVVLSAPSIMFVLNWYPQYMVEARGVTQEGLARYLWVPPLFFDLGAVGFGVLASRRDRTSDTVRTHWPLMLAAAVLGSGLVLVPHVRSAWGAVLLASSSLAGGGAIFALLTADMLARVSLPVVSMAGGMTAAAQSLAYVIANPIVGRVVKRTGSYDGVLVVLGALVLPGAVAWALWPVGQPVGEPSSRPDGTEGSAGTEAT